MFYLISWIAWTIHVLFIILCIAAGLYYIAETIEEYTIYSKQIMQYMIMAVLVILVICFFQESLPISMFLSAFSANCVYYSLLQAFPYIEFNSPTFILSVALFVLKHYVTLNYFADNFVPYDQVIGYFTVCLWVVPFTLLISTSAGENTLPTTSHRGGMHGGHNSSLSGAGHNAGMHGRSGSDVLTHYYATKKKRSSFLMYIQTIKEKFTPRSSQDKHLY